MNFFQEWLADVDIDSEVDAKESSNLTELILEGDFDMFEWGWYVEPDPTSMLSYMTCDQLGNWSDSWYCNEEYDALYEQQQTELDPAARAEQVKQMQEILYDGRALPGDGVQLDRRGLPQRPVRLPAAPAGPRRRSACSSTASTTTSTCVRPTRPATAEVSRESPRLRRRAGPMAE